MGYIPEEEPKPYQELWNAIYESKKPLFDAIREKRDASVEAEHRMFAGENPVTLTETGDSKPGSATETKVLGFDTSPQRDHGWRDLKIVQGQIIEGRDTGDESATE